MLMLMLMLTLASFFLVRRMRGLERAACGMGTLGVRARVWRSHDYVVAQSKKKIRLEHDHN